MNVWKLKREVAIAAAASEPEASELGSILFGTSRSKVQNSNIFNQHSFRAQWFIFAFETEHPVRLPVVCFWIKKLVSEYFVFEQ